MRFKQIIETTTAGSVATVSQPMMTQTRENTNVRGLKPAQQVMKGKAKKKGPYANSIVENKVTEDDLAEQDLIVIPGQGRLRRTGFVKHDLDQGEHEGHTLKNSLHTISRAASELDKRLSTQSEFPEWVSEKIGAAKGMMVSVMDYLISSQEMQHDRDAINEGDVSTSNLRTMYDLARMAKNYCNPEGQESLAELLKILKWYMDQSEQGIAEEKKWNPITGGDFPTDYGADDVETASGANNGEQWQAMLNYYTNDAFVRKALSDLYRQTQGTDFYGSALTADRYLATIELNSFGGKKQRIEKKYFPTKQDAYKYAKGALATVLSIEKIDNTEDESDLITLPVMLGVGEHKKKWMLKFPSETFAQKWEFRHKNVASIQWPGGHDLEQKVDESMGGGVDAKGRTQKQWLQLVKSKYPNASIMQSKMIDGPIQVTLSDGKKLHWEKAEQGVAEALNLDDLRKAAASTRSPEDTKALKRNPDFGKIMQKNVNKHNKAIVKTKKDIGSRVADIGAGGKEYNVKTDAAWDAAKKKVEEGWKSNLAGAALAGAAALGGAGAHAHDLQPIVAQITFQVDGKSITKDINLGTEYNSPGQASEAVKDFMKSKGIKFYNFKLHRADVQPPLVSKDEMDASNQEYQRQQDSNNLSNTPFSAKGDQSARLQTDKGYTSPSRSNAAMTYEGKKVDRFVKHVEKSEEKTGKSKKDAENIAWATANKRGMLDNKNKKA